MSNDKYMPISLTRNEVMSAERLFRIAFEALYKAHSRQTKMSRTKNPIYANIEGFCLAEEQLIARKTIESVMGIMVEFYDKVKVNLDIQDNKDMAKRHREYLAKSKEAGKGKKQWQTKYI